MGSLSIIFHAGAIIRAAYNGGNITCYTEIKFAGEFGIQGEVQQSCKLSPIFFLLVTDDVLNAALSKEIEKVQWTMSSFL